MSEKNVILKAACLEKNLGRYPVLKGASLELDVHSVAAILGPSGCGKTTFLRALAGLESLDGGCITLHDRLLSEPGYTMPPEKRGLGLVFQNHALFPHMTVEQNIAFGLGRTRHKKERVARRLQAARLGGRGGAYPHELSGGEQQRVALARALAPEPPLILLDEPFSSLDGELRLHVRERALEQLRQSGAAVLIVTHDAEEALLMADKLVLMVEGRIIQTGTPEAVYLNPVSAQAARLCGPVNTWSGDVREGGVETPFGRVRADHLSTRARATALVRPEALLVHASNVPQSVHARVVRRRLRGAVVELDVREEKTQTLWTAYTGLASAPSEGDDVFITLNEALSRAVSFKE